MVTIFIDIQICNANEMTYYLSYQVRFNLRNAVGYRMNEVVVVPLLKTGAS